MSSQPSPENTPTVEPVDFNKMYQESINRLENRLNDVNTQLREAKEEWNTREITRLETMKENIKAAIRELLEENPQANQSQEPALEQMENEETTIDPEPEEPANLVPKKPKQKQSQEPAKPNRKRKIF